MEEIKLEIWYLVDENSSPEKIKANIPLPGTKEQIENWLTFNTSFGIPYKWWI